MVPRSSVAVLCSGQTGAKWFSGATLPLATDKLEAPFYFLHRDNKHRIFVFLIQTAISSLLHAFKCKSPA